MKKAFISAIIGTSLFAASTMAVAQGFYLGGSIGQSKFKESCEGATAGVSCDDTDTAWRFFGGYEVNRNFAVEIGYADLGEAKASLTSGGITATSTAKATAWDVVGIGSLPLGPSFALYAKLGLFYGKADGRVSVTGGGTTSESDTGTDLTFGFGARYDFLRNFGARVEWQRYTDFSGSDVDVISAGVLYRF